ncbi:DEAD/DEAH box helicase, partial [Pseudomonas aeruginosa]|uniref:helicase-related protein n=2 Tax=Pseudomonas aeruginosa TaxID=287 RepID=UPI001F090586
EPYEGKLSRTVLRGGWASNGLSLPDQLPQGTFDLLIADEAHEYKNGGSAQGLAMGVLAAKARKTLLLTGTLMGGYGDDIFYLLFRALPGRMIEDGYRPTKSGSMTSAAMAFMRDHGVLKDIYSESMGTAHKTAKGCKVSVRTVKAPGFGPKGVLRCILPFTVFLKLKDIGGNVLPPYDEEFREVAMDDEQANAYRTLSSRLSQELKQALAKRDTTLLGVVLNVLLAWPDTCFRAETVTHPRTRELLAFVASQFNELELMPKERELIDICQKEKAEGRKTLVYSVYTGTRDTTSRLKLLLEQEGFKVAVLRASVDASRREDWIAEQLDRGIDVLITNPELVKTGLDLLEFPTIVFMQSGYNVYSLQQAARRSWRIGQKLAVKVIYLGYAATSQMTCLALMARKIMVSQSTSGDVPESGLDVLNQDGDSVEVALARQLVAA